KLLQQRRIRFRQNLKRSSAFHRFTEAAKRPISLFLRNSGRKTAHTFPGIALTALTDCFQAIPD
ncbi:hypothetical protein, partial [Mesorhizobium sp.]|uniref:hypothetical protein n=1 Tax=Mesorhizobium sp. TaxID=1871066 RepID=UPI0025C3BB45